MLKPAFSKMLFAFVSACALICAPMPASARHTGGAKKGGGSHGGSSHGGGASHGGGHSSFKGGGRSYGGSRGGGYVSSARMNGGHKNSGQLSGSTSAKLGGFSSRSSANFTRNTNLGGGSFGASTASRNFGRFGDSRQAVQGSERTSSRWQSFGNSSGRSVLASAHSSGNLMGGGWHSFGNMNRGGGAEISRGYGGNARTDGQWRSFGNSRNTFSGRNNSGFSSFGANPGTASNPHSANLESRSNRFLTTQLPSTRFSSFSSFSSGSSGSSMGNFGGSRFGVSGFGNSDFGNSSFGGSGFSNSGIGSGVSLIPNLLGGFFGLGTSVFGGRGILGANALSFAVRLFVSAIGASGFGQGGATGDNAGMGQSGFSGNFGLEDAPVWPACGAGGPLWAPVPPPGVYCGPYAYQALPWNPVSYFSGPAMGFHYRQ